jgi:GntR family transcriptional repressor for pyruvate dehydrogenase complex
MMIAVDEPGEGRVRRQVIAEEVAARIEELILRGELAIGDKLPPERVLARELHISRPTLREGIRALSATGTIRVEHGKGSFVSGHPPRARLGTADPDDASPLARAELARLRALLIASAAAQAAIRLDQAALNELVERLAVAVGDGFLAAEALVGALGDDRLSPLIEMLWPRGSTDDSGGLVDPEVVRALAARDPRAAFDAAFRALPPTTGS